MPDALLLPVSISSSRLFRDIKSIINCYCGNQKFVVSSGIFNGSNGFVLRVKVPRAYKKELVEMIQSRAGVDKVRVVSQYHSETTVIAVAT